MTTAKKTTTKAAKGGATGARKRAGATRPAKADQATEGQTAAREGQSAAKGTKPAGEAKAAAPKQAAPPTARRLSLLDHAVEELARSDEPLGAKDLVTRIIDSGRWTTEGKTPQATLYSAMIREIKAKGSQARFQKVSRGRFALNETASA